MANKTFHGWPWFQFNETPVMSVLTDEKPSDSLMP